MLEYLIIFFTVLFKYLILQVGDGSPVLNLIVLLIALLLCVVKIFGQIAARRMPPIGEWSARLLPVAAFVLFMTVLTKDINFLLAFTLACAFAFDTQEVLVKTWLWASLTCFMGQLLAYWLGLTDTVTTVRIQSDGTAAIRDSLGFESPNNSFGFFLAIFLAWYLLRGKSSSKRAWYYLIFGCGIAYIYYMTRSRTGAVLFAFIVLLSFFNVEKIMRAGVVRRLMPYAFFILAAFSVGLARAFMNPDTAVNRLMTGRPYIWSTYLSYGVPIIGTGTKVILPDSVIIPGYGVSLDNFYIYMLHCYGWLPVLLIGVFYWFLFKKLDHYGQHLTALVVLAFLIYGVVEVAPLMISINFTLIYLFISHFNPTFFSRANIERPFPLTAVNRTQESGRPHLPDAADTRNAL